MSSGEGGDCDDGLSADYARVVMPGPLCQPRPHLSQPASSEQRGHLQHGASTEVTIRCHHSTRNSVLKDFIISLNKKIFEKYNNVTGHWIEIEMCPKVFWNSTSSFHTFSLAERVSTFNEFTEETKITWETFLAVFSYFLTEELSDAVLMCLCPVCGLSRSVTVLLWFSSWLTSNSQSESEDCGALTNQRRGLWGTDQSEAGTVTDTDWSCVRRTLSSTWGTWSRRRITSRRSRVTLSSRLFSTRVS